MANLTETNTQASKKSATTFLRSVKSEFKKIIWPTKNELIKYTVLVIVITLIVALIIYGLDFAFTSLLGLLISK